MPFNDLSATQRKFLATHTKAGKALAQASSIPKDPHEADRIDWLTKATALHDRITSTPPALDTSKLKTALAKTRKVYEDDFDPIPAEKALKTITIAFQKLAGTSLDSTSNATKRLIALEAKFLSLQKLAFPEKKTITTKIDDRLQHAKAKIEAGDFNTADRLMDAAEVIITGAQVGVDAKAAIELKPADLKVLMGTQDGQAQLDAIVDNLNDDVPPHVMISILEARFSLEGKLFQNTSDREGSMLDKAKHGAMLETDSPKLKKLYKQMMDKKAAEETGGD